LFCVVDLLLGWFAFFCFVCDVGYFCAWFFIHRNHSKSHLSLLFKNKTPPCTPQTPPRGGGFLGSGGGGGGGLVLGPPGVFFVVVVCGFGFFFFCWGGYFVIFKGACPVSVWLDVCVGLGSPHLQALAYTPIHPWIPSTRAPPPPTTTITHDPPCRTFFLQPTTTHPSPYPTPPPSTPPPLSVTTEPPMNLHPPKPHRP